MADHRSLRDAFVGAAPGHDLLEQHLEQQVLAGLFPEPPRPTQYDRFVVLECVGSGAMGTVFSAYDPKLDRKVALKVMSSRSAVELRRHLDEARALARLSHPNVVTVHDAGEVDGSVFVAMEFVDGETLASLLQRAESPARIVGRFVDAAHGLCAAHKAGVVHRDFKPANVLVGSDGRVRVADFGLACTMELGDEESATADMTRASTVAGTPFYMAPEQRKHGIANARTDQYAFCIALREALGGETDFRGTRAQRRVIERGLRHDPQQRFEHMDAVATALVPRRRATGWLFATLAVGVGVATMYAPSPARPCEDAAAPLQSLYNPTRLAAVDAAFAASQLPYAKTSGAAIRTRLSTYAEQLRDAHLASCERHERGEFSAGQWTTAQQCLARVRNRFDVTMTSLGSAGTLEVPAAHPLVSALPDPRECTQTDPLLQASLPLDPDLRSEIFALQTELDRIEMRRLAGDDDDALASLEALRQRVDAVDFAPLEIELDIGVAHALGRGSPDAAAALERAFLRAEEVGDTRSAAIVAETLARRSMEVRAHDDADRWVDLAAALRSRQLGPGKTTHRIAELEATLAVERNELESALRHVEVYETLSFTDSDQLGAHFLRAEIAVAQDDAGRAMEHLQQAVDLALSRFGPGSDEEVVAMVKRGTASLRLGNPQVAVPDLRRAIAVLEADTESEAPQLFAALNRLATAQLELGDVEPSIATYQELERKLTASFGTPHPVVMGIRINLARALRRGKRYEESVEMFLSARKAASADLETERKAELDREHALTLLAMGRPAAALVLLESWLEDTSVSNGGAFQFAYGVAHYDAGAIELGTRWIRLSAENARKTTGVADAELSEPERWLKEHGLSEAG